MKLSELKPAHRKKGKRLGRGKGSGKGGTSTKGHKGQKARSGFSLKPGFEGGQMTLARRLPKFGFTNIMFKTVYDILNLEQLNETSGPELSIKDMVEQGLVRQGRKVKILAKGEIKRAVKIEAHKLSKKAQAEIEKAGGSVHIIQKKKSK